MIDRLIAAEGLPASYREVVERHWAPLADRIALAASSSLRTANGGAAIQGNDEGRKKRPALIGINGAQGSGKTTLCRFLEPLLAERGLNAATLALDDFYLTKAERLRLAADVHPLFATRGVPGTHDMKHAQSIVDRLSGGRSAVVPRFDKAADDRAPQGRDIPGPVDVILFEGWCVGAIPQPYQALAEPVNALERLEDPAGTWRREVDRRLAADYAEVFGRIDFLVMLKVESFAAVRANRLLQEQKLARSNPAGAAIMDEPALDRFLQHYERLTRWMLEEMPARADELIPIGPDQKPAAEP